MISQSLPTTSKHEEFSLPLFLFTVSVTLAVISALLWLVAPAVFEAQLISPWWKWLTAFLVGTLVNCFIEYFFHRYVLHMPALPGLSRLYRQHTLHHALTRIARKPTSKGRSVLFVENKFPIVEAEQGEGSFFPWYSLGVFSALITPLLAALNLLWPSFPWFIAGFASMATSVTLYELLHAINHWPLEQWLPLIEHPTWGWFWRPVYSFHLRHHAVIECNESISGFFGIPITDWVFGTCLIPRTIYADGEEWMPENFTAPRPRAFIRWLDERASNLVRRRREAQAVMAVAAPDPKRHYSRGEEIANWLTHGIGAALSVAGLTLLIIFAGARGDAWHIISFTVFGLTLLALYTVSALHHLSRSERRKWMFRRMGRAAIFLVIAGTCTPFVVTQLRGAWGWTLFGVIWGVCGAGAVFKFFWDGRYRTVSMLAYAASGWLIVLAAKPLLAAVPEPGLWLLLAGTLLYSVGIVFYLWRRLRYHHAFRHSFLLGGSTCHFLAVLLFLTPVAA